MKNNEKNAFFKSCYNNDFKENFWDDYNPIIEDMPYIIWGKIFGIIPFLAVLI